MWFPSVENIFNPSTWAEAAQEAAKTVTDTVRSGVDYVTSSFKDATSKAAEDWKNGNYGAAIISVATGGIGTYIRNATNTTSGQNFWDGLFHRATGHDFASEKYLTARLLCIRDNFQAYSETRCSF